jgi:hypothetical protein
MAHPSQNQNFAEAYIPFLFTVEELCGAQYQSGSFFPLNYCGEWLSLPA